MGNDETFCPVKKCKKKNTHTHTTVKPIAFLFHSESKTESDLLKLHNLKKV